MYSNNRFSVALVCGLFACVSYSEVFSNDSCWLQDLPSEGSWINVSMSINDNRW